MSKKKIALIVTMLVAIFIKVICTIIMSDAQDGGNNQNHYYQSYRNNILGVAGDFCVFTYSDASVSEVTADIAIGGNFSGQAFGNYNTNWNFYKKNDLKYVNLNSYVQGKYDGGTYNWKGDKTKTELTTNSGLIKGTYDVENVNGKANLYIYTGNGDNVISPSNPNQTTVNGKSYENAIRTDSETGVTYNAYNAIPVDYKFIDFDKEFEELEKISETLINHDSQIYVDCISAQSNKVYTYNIPEDKDTVLITVDSNNFFNENICDTFNINGLTPNKKIIINVNCEGHLGDRSPMTQINGSPSDWNALAENVVFNFYLPNFIEDTIEAKEIIGTILAPNMNIFINGNLDGAVIARKVTANNAIYGINSDIAWSDVNATPEKETITISGKKIWDDNNNEKNARPETILLTLYKKGTDGSENKVEGITNPITVSASDSNEWEYTFEKVDKYDDNNNEIQYIVKEDSVEGYNVSIEGYIITNTYQKTEEKTSIEITKEWKDNNNEKGKRPTSITVRLFANNKEIDSKILTEKDNWTYKFENLPLKENGEVIKYTVTEDKIENYITTINEYNIINTYIEEDVNETVDVTINKIWKDEGHEKSRPTKVIVNLFADGTKIKSQEITADDDWKYTFKNLEKYNKENKEIAYTISEDDIPGYTTEINGFTITNKYVQPVIEEKLNLTIEKYEAGSAKKLEDVKLEIKLQDINNQTIINKTEITNSNGQILIENIELPEGEYYLIIKEQTAPSGYEKAEDTNIKFYVKKQNNEKIIELKENYNNVSINKFSMTVKIENKKISEQITPEKNEIQNNIVENNVIDNSMANNVIPQTGETEKIIKIVIIASVLVIAAYCIYNYKKLNF